MTSRPISLIDRSHARVAALDVRGVGDSYEGTIDLAGTSPRLRALFERFEEVVEGQMFSLLDAVEEEIGQLPLKVEFEDGTEALVEDLQVYPSTRAVSFKARRA